MSNAATKQRFAKPFIWAIIALGFVACVFTISRVQLSDIGLRFALISLLTLSFGSRMVVQIPRVKGQISVSDTFIMLAVLLFGGELGILLAAADAVCSSRRITRQKTIIIFNAAVYILSTFLTVWVLRLAFGNIAHAATITSAFQCHGILSPSSLIDPVTAPRPVRASPPAAAIRPRPWQVRLARR